MKSLVIIGCGGHGREMAYLAKRMEEAGHPLSVAGFIDELNPQERTVAGLPVFGGTPWIKDHADSHVFICAIGNPRLRREAVQRAEKFGVSWATLIDPDAVVWKDSVIGEGSMICGGTRMTVNVKVGRHVIVNLGCVLTHDLVMRDFATLGAGVHLAGAVTIGEGADLGSGVNVIPGVTIGAWTIIGAGAAVVRDIPPRVTAVGVPARVIKRHALET